ncbi:alpha/beta hydrolase [Pelolinea submarina]|uniref:Carboxylesterase n=1 Tax=Pelolinea submarina TaxID=913107 RepID=A0A347ZSJ6_9CHLR|nr:alpha/beta fold hydrolase [Pelolinea submarina]REG11156.1 carboxylesterase [Pelolinea submarina]BBB48277.1 carboxylesterase [Pelolinea submarina]
MKERKGIQTIPTAEPFFLPGGKTGVVLIHGFTGAPKEMRQLGDALHGHGLSVLGVRLVGHATQPDDMRRTRWWDWLASVEDSINLLSGTCDRIFYAGLSLGGDLALIAAARIPPAGVIAMSAPFTIDRRARYLKLISWLAPWYKKDGKPPETEDLQHRHVEYSAYPTRSLAELYTVTQTMQQSLEHITSPVLLINSKSDTTVPIEHAARIKRLLNAAEIDQVILETSGHVVTEGDEKEIVFDAAYQFIQKHC